MPKSTRKGLFGGGDRVQTISVIDTPTRHNQQRKAIIAFWVALIVVATLGGTVAASYMHPILGGLLGVVLGVVSGALLAALIIIWPVLRMIWHWLPEIALGLFLIYGWQWLMFATPLWASLLILAVIIGAPSAYGPARRAVISAYWCLAVRHRLRTCFAAFIAKNRQGTLPLILIAKPTPVGERIWLWLRPGLSLHDLAQEGQMQRIAVACWAREVRVTAASRKYAALVRIDVTRRESLTATIVSPLPDLVPDDMPATAAPVSDVVPFAVNLDDVPAPRSPRSPNESRPRRPRNPEPQPSDSADPSDYA